MNAFSGAINAWWSIVFYSANFAPAFTAGMWAMIGTSIALGIWTAGLTYMSVRTERRRELVGAVVDEEAPWKESPTDTKVQ